MDLISNILNKSNEQQISSNEQQQQQQQQQQTPQPKAAQRKSPSKKVDNNVRIRSPDLEMDYEDNDNKKKSSKKKGIRTPHEDNNATDFGGCIVGIGNGLTYQLNEISNSFSTMFNDSPKENNIDKKNSDVHYHHNSHLMKTKSCDTEADWTSRPGTPEERPIS